MSVLYNDVQDGLINSQEYKNFVKFYAVIIQNSRYLWLIYVVWHLKLDLGGRA